MIGDKGIEEFSRAKKEHTKEVFTKDTEVIERMKKLPGQQLDRAKDNGKLKIAGREFPIGQVD